MYNRTFDICLFGLGEEAAEAMRAVPAPERFTVNIVSADAIDLDLARNASVCVVGASVLDNVSLAELSAAARDGKVGMRGLIVAAPSDFTASLDADQLAHIDCLWPSPLTPAVAAFECEKLLGAAAQQARAYMSETFLDTIIDSMPAMVWFKALDGEHVKVNEYFCEIVDKPRSDVEGQFHNYIWNVPEEDWEKAELTCQESDNNAINAGDTVRCDEFVSTHGEIRLFDTYKTPVFDEDGATLGTSGYAHDVTDEREMRRLLWQNARTDYLTGLYNRRFFYEYLAEHHDEGPMTFVLIDLDNFKAVNDDYGHDAGDNTLLMVTNLLREFFDECPVVRWGGDEFIVVLPRVKAGLASDENLDALEAALAERTEAECPMCITASIGVVVQNKGISVDEAIKQADEALYRAKQSGKAQHVRY